MPTHWILLEEGAIEQLPACWSTARWGPRVIVVADERTHEAAGRQACRALRAGGFYPQEVVFRLPLHATAEAATWLDQQWGAEVGSALAVGSGTVNDLVKWVAGRRRVSYVSLATAASVNGYTSPITALTVEGVKRTLPASPPVGVLSDPAVLAAAPDPLTASGFADLISKAVSDTDWRLSRLLRDECYCPLPRRLVEPWEAWLTERLPSLRAKQPEAVAGLLQALIDSGLGMTIAGLSSPASGGEHLISHWLDMGAERQDRVPALHGLQVGLGTLASTALYQLWLDSDPSSWRPAPEVLKPPSERRAELKERYGRRSELVLAELERKWMSADRVNATLQALACRWEEVRALIMETWRPPWQQRRLLKAVGAALHPEELGIQLDEFREAVLHAGEIRGRWTILDIAYLVGLLPTAIDQMMALCGWEG